MAVPSFQLGCTTCSSIFRSFGRGCKVMQVQSVCRWGGSKAVGGGGGACGAIHTLSAHTRTVQSTGGATHRFWTPTTPPTNCWPEAPWGGGDLRGGFREGEGGGGYRRGWRGGGAPGGSVGGGVQVGQFGVVGGGVQVGRFGVLGGGGAQAPLTSPCPPSNHTITINLTLTFAASWFGHASHVDWAEQDPPNFVHGCFCHIIALHFGPQHSL